MDYQYYIHLFLNPLTSVTGFMYIEAPCWGRFTSVDPLLIMEKVLQTLVIVLLSWFLFHFFAFKRSSLCEIVVSFKLVD